MRTKFVYIAALAAVVSGCDVGTSGMDSTDPFQCSLVFSIEWVNLTQQTGADKAVIARATALKEQSEQRIAQLNESSASMTKKAQAASLALQRNEDMTLDEQTEFYEACAKQYPDAPAAPNAKNGFVE